MTATGNRRERKKRETRERLAHVATLLFIERGFDPVTIAEIADAADVSKMTVTNYFPLKEDLVFDAHEVVVASLAEVVRRREPGEPALAALRRQFLASLAGNDVLNGRSTRDFAVLVHESPRLRARQRELDELREAALAAELAAAEGAGEGDPLPVLMAGQLAATHRVLWRRVQEMTREGVPEQRLVPEAAQLAERAFGLAGPALAGYCVRR
ncbi:TetR family transcriptional regulator [Amycolatopsis sp. PS_44_ISF1]|uniref:TetR/AcrR family transcriptional regulator n=1 Tax=Amycolatopsis sp. PS_44_ISF1 TaxID=2974917 RepID=UPI0028DFB974|nr:TetR family transcriptional regulator [Amycolatopsis sp. PS_44_ISF1]MDT8913099.1 TetR/AcrR family transcriptional regulator [Amycolatopsis sp. PS_44_ISF1]